MKKCPICKVKLVPPFTALSRKDNVTEICPECGMTEAIFDWAYQEPQNLKC